MFSRSKSQKSSKRPGSQRETSPANDGDSNHSPGHKSHGFVAGMASSLPKNIFSIKSRKGSKSSSKENLSKTSSPQHQTLGSSSKESSSPIHSYSLSHGGNIVGYYEGGLSSGLGSMSPPGSKSPFNSPTNSLNSKLMKERYDREQAFMMGDRSLDRLPYSARSDLLTSTSPTTSPRSSFGMSSNNRDRSLDRDYPHVHMGARSLEREQVPGNNRSRSNERPDYTSQLYQTQEVRNFRDTLYLDLQSQIADLNKECAKLQQELDSTKDKLSSSMNSIKTFWSPELKKERALRKEESAKYCLLNEQLKVTQAELKKQSTNVQNLESQLLRCEDVQASSQISQTEIEILQREKEKQAKEIVILKKTVEEMEIRIETQKKTLAARDESMKKLLEMLQSKGLSSPVQKMEEDRVEIEKLQSQVFKNESQIRKLEENLSQAKKEISNLEEEKSRLVDDNKEMRLELKHQPASAHTLQAMLEAKDSRIQSLEKELQGLEDKLLQLQEEGKRPSEKDGSLKDSLSTKEKTLKKEIEKLKKDLVTKDTEIEGWKLKFEAFGSQQGEHQQYISVLKEQIAAKEKNLTMLQADMEDLRDRLKDKDSTIERKAKHSQSLQLEKRKIEQETSDLKEQIDHREKKIENFAKKIGELERSIIDRDEEILQMKAAAVVASTAAEANSVDIASIEESLIEKDRQIEKLKEYRDRLIAEHREECEMYEKSNQDIKAKYDSLQTDLHNKQTELCELREQATEASSEKFQYDSKVRQLENKVKDQSSTIQKLQSELEQGKSGPGPANMASLDKQVVELTSQVETARNEANSLEAESLKLKEELQEAQKDGEEKDGKIKEQEEIIKEYRQKVGTLKRNKQAEKKKNAHLLEEARKRQEEISGGATELQSTLSSKNDRIEELEEALKESVKITAEREMAMAELHVEMEELKQLVEEMKEERRKQNSLDQSEKIVALNKQLEEKDQKLRRLLSERHKHLEEVYEMKQEAIQAAISEKDANIALLEMTSTKTQRNNSEIERLTKEKEKLHLQLKDLTQNRVKLIHKQEKREDARRARRSHRSRSASTEKVDPYVLTAPESLDGECRHFYSSSSAATM